MNKELVIKCCKCVLVLNENELFNGLKPEVLQTALKRGKGYKRALAVEKRLQKISPENCNCLTECETCNCGGNENVENSKKA